jgi:hypothetical protein
VVVVVVVVSDLRVGGSRGHHQAGAEPGGFRPSIAGLTRNGCSGWPGIECCIQGLTGTGIATIHGTVMPILIDRSGCSSTSRYASTLSAKATVGLTIPMLMIRPDASHRGATSVRRASVQAG